MGGGGAESERKRPLSGRRGKGGPKGFEMLEWSAMGLDQLTKRHDIGGRFDNSKENCGESMGLIRRTMSMWSIIRATCGTKTPGQLKKIIIFERKCSTIM